MSITLNQNSKMKGASAMRENTTTNSEIFVGSAAASTPGRIKLN
jgi:hypothetical protein